MKLNNKGFAISAILYSVLILFLLVLVSYLSLLSNERNFLLKSKKSIIEETNEKTIEINRIVYNSNTDFYLTPYRGNYLIIASGKQGYIYLPKNTLIQANGNNVKFNKDITINLASQNSSEKKYIFDKIVNASQSLTNQIKILSVNTSKNSVSENTKDFVFTNGVQEFIVPQTGYYEVELWGAQGGSMSGVGYTYDGISRGNLSYTGGLGGYTKGIVELNQGEIIYIFVGEKAGDNISMSNIPCNETGGFNGGGSITTGQCLYGTAGGGATDIRIGGTNVINRIMVAGGGGAANFRNYGYGEGDGGSGGGLIGDTGKEALTAGSYFRSDYPPGYFLGTGGTQTSGGSTIVYSLDGTVSNSGVFGNFGGTTNDSQSGAGGGYYGGARSGHGGGGGGSSYISGYAGVNSVNENTTITHNNNTVHYSGKYFIKTEMKSNINEGNGKARITYIGAKPERINTTLNNVRYIKTCSNGSNANGGNHFVELQAIYNGENIAMRNTTEVTESHGYLQANDTTQKFKNVVDGLIDNITGDSGYAFSDHGSNTENCMIVDLKSTYDLDEVAVWNYWVDGRTYNDTITSVSSNKTSWTTIIDKQGAETSEGKRVNAYSG